MTGLLTSAVHSPSPKPSSIHPFPNPLLQQASHQPNSSKLRCVHSSAAERPYLPEVSSRIYSSFPSHRASCSKSSSSPTEIRPPPTSQSCSADTLLLTGCQPPTNTISRLHPPHLPHTGPPPQSTRDRESIHLYIMEHAKQTLTRTEMTKIIILERRRQITLIVEQLEFSWYETS